MDGLVLSDGVFDWVGDELFDLLRGRSGPCAGGHSNPHRNIRILALWHGMVAKPAPHQDANQEHPGNLWVLNEEPWKVMGFLDPIPVAAVCHHLPCLLSRYLRNDFDGVAIFQELRSDGDHLLTELHPRDSNRAFIGRAQLHFAQTCKPFAAPFLRYYHSEAAGF